MLKKITRLFTDNRIKDLLSGNMVINEGIINEFIKLKGMPTGFRKLKFIFGSGIAGIEAEGSYKNIAFKIKGGARLMEVKINSKEQVVKLMPAEKARIKTDNLDLSVTIKPWLIEEIRTLLELTPEHTKDIIFIEDAGIKIMLHKIPVWQTEFEKHVKDIPLAKEWDINILDYVEVTGIFVEPGAVRIMAKRPGTKLLNRK